MLSDADMLLWSSSKFSLASGNRAVCPQRRFEIRGHPRHTLVNAQSILRSLSDSGQVNSAIMNKEVKDKLIKIMPGGGDNSCFLESEPARACLCQFKIGHVEKNKTARSKIHESL
jgi:hypothetical protein